jgi:hypothetical protein
MAASRRDSKFEGGRVVLIDQPKMFYDEPSPTDSAFSVDMKDCKLPTSPRATLASPWRHSQTIDYFQHVDPDKADVLFDVNQDDSCSTNTRWPTSLPYTSGLGISSPSSPRSGRKMQQIRKQVQSSTRKQQTSVADFFDSLRPTRLAAVLRTTIKQMYQGSPSKKSCPSTPLASASSYNPESVLVLSLCGSGYSDPKSSSNNSRRLYAPQRPSLRSKSRTTTLPIPAASGDLSNSNLEKSRWSQAAASTTSLSPLRQQPANLTPAPFDDEAFFHRLRSSYTTLRGGSLWRTCSARSLRRITVRGRGPQDFFSSTTSNSSALDIPSSPSSSPEDNLLTLFLHPALSRHRTTHVQWARRIANMPTLRIVPPRAEEDCAPDPDDAAAEPADDDCELGLSARSAAGAAALPEGLVFEIGFSWRRILGVLGVVVGAAVLMGCAAGPAAVLGVGGSVASAVVLGGVVLVAGLLAVLGWLALSWVSL